MKRIIIAAALATMSTSAFAADVESTLLSVYKSFDNTLTADDLPTLADPITLSIDDDTGYITASGNGGNITAFIAAVNIDLFAQTTGYATKWVDDVVAEAVDVTLGQGAEGVTIAAWVEDFNNTGDELDDVEGGFKASVTEYENSTFNSAVDVLKDIDTYDITETDFSGLNATSNDPE